MNFENVAIESIGYVLAPNRITSMFIEGLLEPTMGRLHIPRGLLETLTGIRERRFWNLGVPPSEVATKAAQKVIDKAEIDSDKIGCLVNTSVSRDYLEPSVASLVHGNLNLSPHCINYDVTNACLGFIDGMRNIAMLIETGEIKYGLVVAGEDSRTVVESTIRNLQQSDVSLQTFRDSIAALTLGSGAVAMVLCHKDVSKNEHFINGTVSLAATQYNRLCVGHQDYMMTDAVALLKASIGLAKETWQLASKKLQQWSDAEISLYAPHQVSARTTKVMIEMLGLTPAKLHLNFPMLGNMGPAGLPITLAMADESGRLKKGDHVGLLGIGSGLNCTVMSVTW